VKQPAMPDGRHATEDFTLAKAAIFDLDGTLLDSVDLHAIAWHEAMMKFLHDVSFEQARAQIGEGGDAPINDVPERTSASREEIWTGLPVSGYF
jgi:beta-phosphoglucomutase-like phosphatase (HAD superfamily)